MRRSATGLRWARPRRECPEWCARRGGWCPAREGYPSAEHRSAPVQVAPYGPVAAVVTLSRSPAASETAVEVRLVVGLGGGDERAAASRVLAAVAVLAQDLAVKADHGT